MTIEAKQVPLYEQLEDVPIDARLVIEDSDGTGATILAIGRMCHGAAAALRAAIEQAEPLHEANEAFAKRQEWWNNKMFEMESELQRYKKIAVVWQGLTEEELDAMRQESKLDFVTLREFRVVARAVEEKLKEKNG